MTAEDAEDIAGMLVKTGRGVHPGTWVESLMRESVANQNAEQLRLILG